MSNHPTNQSSDTPAMHRALQLARAQLGQTWPNPAVGCVIVRDNQIMGEGATARGGRPHAETIALAKAGGNARGATLYVTLEPCNHHGETPPCVDTIIAAAIARVVVACRDPCPVAGGGLETLKNSGIEIVEGVCREEARELNRGFFSVVEKKRPYIAMKIATSADGKIASAPGVKTDITSPEAREHGQALRAEFDAILTGIGTVFADDPLLTVRISGMEHRSPIRVVLDSRGRIPPDSKLMQTANDVPLWVMRGNLPAVIAELSEKGITRLLIEAGQGVNTSFLAGGIVDRIYWYLAPKNIGAQGLDALKYTNIQEALKDWQQVGDVLEIGDNKLTIFEKDKFPLMRV